jgi:hypothetical protein
MTDGIEAMAILEEFMRVIIYLPRSMIKPLCPDERMFIGTSLLTVRGE